MKNYAIIKDNIVTNVLVAESIENLGGLAEFAVESTPANPAHIGLGFNGTTFEQPVTE
jgi:hypothetical protein